MVKKAREEILGTQSSTPSGNVSTRSNQHSLNLPAQTHSDLHIVEPSDVNHSPLRPQCTEETEEDDRRSESEDRRQDADSTMGDDDDAEVDTGLENDGNAFPLHFGALSALVLTCGTKRMSRKEYSIMKSYITYIAKSRGQKFPSHSKIEKKLRPLAESAAFFRPAQRCYPYNEAKVVQRQVYDDILHKRRLLLKFSFLVNGRNGISAHQRVHRYLSIILTYQRH